MQRFLRVTVGVQNHCRLFSRLKSCNGENRLSTLGVFMPLDQIVSLFSALISFAGLVFVALQLRDGNKQQELASLVEIYDINRELLTLGFSQPKLFEILADAPQTDATLERRYLQLWLNQFAIIHSYMEEAVFKRELKDSLTREVAEFFTMENMQRHWRHHGAFYPVSFQEFVSEVLKKNEPPKPAAQDDSGC